MMTTRPPAAPSGAVAAYRATTTEQAMQDGILEMARRLKYHAYHTYDSRRSAYGFPDTIIVGHHRIIVFELKGPKGRVTDAQRGWIAAFAASGAIAMILWPHTYDDALALLQRIAEEAER